MDKIAHSLRLDMGLKPDSPIPVIAKYNKETIKKGIGMAPLGFQPSRVFKILPALSLRLLSTDIEAVSRLPEVEYIWPDLYVHTCLDVSVPLIQAPKVWEAGYTGKGVKVAIVDTGIDPYHPDFGGRIASTADFTGEGIIDRYGHGTHVAGIVAGNGRASDGLYRGVAPEASLYVAKVLGKEGGGLTSTVIAGLEWAVDNEVDIINLSLGGDPPGDGRDALSEVCDIVVERGFVVCVAAGNAGPDPGTIGPPGCARQVITVGASTDKDQIADFSACGPTEDGREKPDIVLPGVDITACRAKGTNMGTPSNEHYTQASGTSMATPHASGVAALLLQARPALTPAQVKGMLMKSAVNINYPRQAQGGGRADAYAALTMEPIPVESTPTPTTDGCLARLLSLMAWGQRRK
jgi:subtilisin family serine protease